jgi:farnesyl-diphosphate farnesyltransferase
MSGTPEDLELANAENLSDDELQSLLLDRVSRTFALTIPQLPPALAKAVANGYLLCRIVDTIEDEATLASEQKRRFCQQFIAVVAAQADPAELSRDLGACLSEVTPPSEHRLIQLIPRVVAITHGFEPAQRDALSLCIEIMGKGMADYQQRDLTRGLKDLPEMNEYCYYVAGVVGEMLTRLFCHYSPEIAAHREKLMPLAVSFGQGLQMTNILKDLWDDHQRDVCWLPRDIFVAAGFDLGELQPGHNHPGFQQGYRQLIAVAHGHLRNALEYTLMIPAHETGIREFCLWALGMALLTLRKIHSHPNFSESSQVKISRTSVKATVLTSRLTRSNDFLLKTVFSLSGIGMPAPASDILIPARSADL